MRNVSFSRVLKGKRGLTLVEILVALSIIAIMVFSITPLIVMSLTSISNSGGKNSALFDAKASVEIGVSEKEASTKAEIPIRFLNDAAGSVNKVSGGLVEKDVISTFVANAPSITIAPFVLNEGYADAPAGSSYITVQVSGSNTHFKTGSTSISVKDKNGFNIGGISALTVNSTTSASFRLPVGIGNIGSPLTVKVDSKVYTGAAVAKDETARTDLVINLPRYIAVGAGGINIISDDKVKWYSKISGLSGQLNSIAWGNDRFIAAGNNGGLYRLRAGSGWTALATGISNDINSVERLNNSFIAAGSSGLILTSTDGETWTSATTPTTENLKSVAYNGSIYAAVGNNGSILVSADLNTWTVPAGVTGLGNANLNDIEWCNNKFVAVGDNGLIMISSADGNYWEKLSFTITGLGNPMGSLSSVRYNASLIVAASNNGKIYTSTDGTGWTYRQSGTTRALNDIVWNDGSFIIAGESGTILTSPDGITWTLSNSPTTGSLYGICKR